MAAAALMLAVAPAAQAAFGLSGVQATPAADDAGANTDLTLALQTPDAASDIRDLTIHLPPGLVGNPQATARCTEAELLDDGNCPAASDVGDVSNNVTASVLGFLPVALTVSGDVYNVVPRAGEPARFGIVLDPSPIPLPGNPLLPKIILQSAASLRPGDLGLDTVLTDLPREATVLGLPTPVHINSVALTLAGQVGSPPQGFIRLPTSCKTHTVGFDATAYDSQTASGAATFTTTNCGALPFTPELSAEVKQGDLSDAVELTTTISQTIDEAGLKRAQVTLPKELFGNAAALGVSCPDADFQAGSCPANTIVGSAVAASPLLSEPLSGPVALVDPAAPGLPDLGIDLRGPLALKLKGTIAITADVRNEVAFDGLPDIPIADFALTFAGGPSGLTFATRDLCEPPPVVFDATFDSHSGATASASPTASVACSGSGGGGNGANRKPRAKVKLRRLGSRHPAMKLKVKAGSEKLRRVSVGLPRGLGFAGGTKFKRGAKLKAGGGKLRGGAVKHSKRKLTVRLKRTSGSLRGRFARGALHAGKHLRARKLRFKLVVRDAAGKSTRLSVRAK